MYKTKRSIYLKRIKKDRVDMDKRKSLIVTFFFLCIKNKKKGMREEESRLMSQIISFRNSSRF